MQIGGAFQQTVNLAAQGSGKQGCDAKNNTKHIFEGPLSSQVIEENGRDDGTRTRGLCRDSDRFRGNRLKINGAVRLFWRSE